MTTGPTYSAEEIRALVEASVSLTSELTLDTVLQKVVDVARGQIGAKYAALSVLSAEGGIQRFVTSGITEEERAAIGDIPVGHGLLSVLLNAGATLRMDDLSQDPRSVGFPPNHPPMKSLLGVSVVSRGRVLGNLYLTEKEEATGFDDRDEDLVRLLSTQAAVAITNAQLYEKLESLARLEERDRIGMDLHDGAIQSIYAVVLHLEDVFDRLPDSANDLKLDVERAMDDLNKVIKDIRSYILDLRPQLSNIDDLPGALRQLVEQFRVNTLVTITLDVSQSFAGAGGEDPAMALFHIAQEALNNVSKHSKATSVAMRLGSTVRSVTLEVEDNGVGFDVPPEGVASVRNGLRNMRDRARSVGADLTYDSSPGSGTRVRVDLPVRRKDESLG
ncbi:MAG: GAF domain-containing sensor histidine kinase [Dehalococcoidia bacterium]